MALYEFTDKDVSTLRVMIDLAVKFAGMQVAQSAVTLTEKLKRPYVPPAPDAKEKKG